MGWPQHRPQTLKEVRRRLARSKTRHVLACQRDPLRPSPRHTMIPKERDTGGQNQARRHRQARNRGDTNAHKHGRHVTHTWLYTSAEAATPTQRNAAQHITTEHYTKSAPTPTPTPTPKPKPSTTSAHHHTTVTTHTSHTSHHIQECKPECADAY